MWIEVNVIPRATVRTETDVLNTVGQGSAPDGTTRAVVPRTVDPNGTLPQSSTPHSNRNLGFRDHPGLSRLGARSSPGAAAGPRNRSDYEGHGPDVCILRTLCVPASERFAVSGWNDGESQAALRQNQAAAPIDESAFVLKDGGPVVLHADDRPPQLVGLLE